VLLYNKTPKVFDGLAGLIHKSKITHKNRLLNLTMIFQGSLFQISGLDFRVVILRFPDFPGKIVNNAVKMCNKGTGIPCMWFTKRLFVINVRIG